MHTMLTLTTDKIPLANLPQPPSGGLYIADAALIRRTGRNDRSIRQRYLDKRVFPRTSTLVLLMITLMSFFTPTVAQATSTNVQTITALPTGAPIMSLTFDTDTIRGREAAILDTLAARGIKATFAVTGLWATQSADLIQRMVREGHHLINHSWSHPFFTRISSGQRTRELRQTEDLVRSLTGVELRPFFRPPYGDYNEAVLRDLEANGYTLNMWWTIDSGGWRGWSAAQVSAHVLAHAQPGAIVLMHSNVQADVQALPGIIDTLLGRGYSFSTLADWEYQPTPVIRIFPETGHSVGHGFLRFWQRYGGVAIFGYPITEETQENGVTVQYFERARFEYRPGSAPARFDVQLGLIGREIVGRQRGGPAFTPAPPGGNPHCTFIPQTQHHICWGFRTFWRTQGDVEIFGYPISEEFDENGITVQYFERARFEYHPNNPAPHRVLLSRLGVELLTPRGP